MRTEKELQALMLGNSKDMEVALNIKIRNGQAPQAVRATLKWVLDQQSSRVPGVTKEDFIAYEKVRVSGQTNMFDTTAVQNWSNLLAHHTLESKTIGTIMKNYEALCAQFPDVRRTEE